MWENKEFASSWRKSKKVIILLQIRDNLEKLNFFAVCHIKEGNKHYLYKTVKKRKWNDFQTLKTIPLTVYKSIYQNENKGDKIVFLFQVTSDRSLIMYTL